MSNARDISSLHPLQPDVATLTGLADITFASGSYTPSVTAVLNMDSVADPVGYYFRIGNIVYVYGRVTADVTAAGRAEFSMTLPIASNFTTINDLAGTFVVNSTISAMNYGVIVPDVDTDRALFRTIATNLNGNTAVFNFSYQVL